MRKLAITLAGAVLALSAPSAMLPLAAKAASARVETVRIDARRIDSALAKMVGDGRAAGTSALVWHGGREVYFGHAGFADREAKRAMSRDTIVQIFSMTKPITGVALMQLWEQGRFGMDDKLARYLPEFANVRVYAGKDANGVAQYRPPLRPIQVRDIMRHSAGFSGPGEDNPVFALYKQADPTALNVDLSEMGRRVSSVPLHYDPGEHWYYGVAVDVQALLIEKLAGEPYAKYVQDHVLGPLGMKDTAWRQPDANWAHFAALYLKKDGALARQDDATTRALNFPGQQAHPGRFRPRLDGR